MSVEDPTRSREHATHHVYDDIEEDDHPLPVWWLGTFFITVFFGLGYWFWYHSVQAGESLAQTYEHEVAALPKHASISAAGADALIALEKDPEALVRGGAVYAQNCVACHGAQGQGIIGPNLTDGFWIHGSDAVDVATTISEGVAAKGMPAWGALLGDKKVLDAYAFVASLKNTNVPGKAPQGVDAQGNAPPATN